MGLAEEGSAMRFGARADAETDAVSERYFPEKEEGFEQH